MPKNLSNIDNTTNPIGWAPFSNRGWPSRWPWMIVSISWQSCRGVCGNMLKPVSNSTWQACWQNLLPSFNIVFYSSFVAKPLAFPTCLFILIEWTLLMLSTIHFHAKLAHQNWRVILPKFLALRLTTLVLSNVMQLAPIWKKWIAKEWKKNMKENLKFNFCIYHRIL